MASYLGQHDGGPPTSGTHGVGDWSWDSTTPAIWTCVSPGTPGTFEGSDSSPILSGIVTALGFATTGLTGATAATRFVGGTTTGAPVSGTFAVGDFVVTHDAHVIVCTTAGSPGTWTDQTGATAASTVTGADAFGATPVVGVGTTYARNDHDHGLPADPTADLRASTGATTLIYPEQHATSGAPAYVKGALYYDTTLSKLRVGGATAWETVTSV